MWQLIRSGANECTFQIWPSRPLLGSGIFGYFQTNNAICTTNWCENISIWWYGTGIWTHNLKIIDTSTFLPLEKFGQIQQEVLNAQYFNLSGSIAIFNWGYMIKLWCIVPKNIRLLELIWNPFIYWRNRRLDSVYKENSFSKVKDLSIYKALQKRKLKLHILTKIICVN